MASLVHIMPEHIIGEIDAGYLQGGYTNEWCEKEEKRTGYFLSIVREENREEAIFWSAGGFYKIYKTEILFEGMPGGFLGKTSGEKSEIELKGEILPETVLRNMFEQKESSSTPCGQRQEQQRESEYSNFMCELSQQGALENKQITTYRIVFDGVLLERTMPAPLTKGIGAGYWPTPAARDYNGANGPDHMVFGKRSHMGQLPNAVAYKVTYPTPTKSDGTGGPGNSPGRGGDNLRTACARIGSPLWPTPTICGNYNRKGASDTSGDGLATDVKKHEKNTTGQLSPDWVCWLMGWPIGWEDLEREHTKYMDWSEDPADAGGVPRVCTGMKHRAVRLKAIGNGQCPQAMVLAWNILIGVYHV
jgi:hypothetical protein